ncbi:MAG: prephenate dehydratase [Chloroflexota bacterium]|nr:prephenate dehydratase [Chloroflexota bacterium]MEC7788967.1 prephenate dehydratase [Chloroflexota bacterium]|tara:strand:- start:1633 stop:2460 length:828 start_codon:yes stop_codon:yes gene_type:complete
MKKVTHLGPAGTYTEMAARAFGGDAELIPLPSVAEVIDTVIRNDADMAVCAFENSIAGTVSIETIDLLLNPHFPLNIYGEVVLDISHMLIARDQLDLDTINTVFSHPSALAQCRQSLQSLVPQANQIELLSTTAAVEAAMANGASAAIAGDLAAREFGAYILAREIGDEKHNATRFLVLSKDKTTSTGDDKTTLVFNTIDAESAGSLVNVLEIFAKRGINLTRIESRPTRRQLGTYIFSVDVQGHQSDENVAQALEEMEMKTSWVNVLGSYARWK